MRIFSRSLRYNFSGILDYAHRLTPLSLLARRYFHADGSRFARPYIRLLHSAVSALRASVQDEDGIRRGRRDLRIMEETQCRSLFESLPVQCNKSWRIHGRPGEQAPISTSRPLRVQVSRIRIPSSAYSSSKMSYYEHTEFLEMPMINFISYKRDLNRDNLFLFIVESILQHRFTFNILKWFV